MTHAIYYYLAACGNLLIPCTSSYPDKPHEFPMSLSCLAIVMRQNKERKWEKNYLLMIFMDIPFIYYYYFGESVFHYIYIP